MLKTIIYIRITNQEPMTLYATQNMFEWRFGA